MATDFWTVKEVENLESEGADVANVAAAEVEDAEVRSSSEEAIGQPGQLIRRQIQLGQSTHWRQERRETRSRRIIQSNPKIIAIITLI